MLPDSHKAGRAGPAGRLLFVLSLCLFFSACAGLPDRQADALSRAGLVHFQNGDYPAAIEAFESAVARQQSRGDDRARAHDLNNLARLYVLVGQADAAQVALDEALDLAAALDAAALIATTRLNLGNLALNLRCYSCAVEHLRQALAIAPDSSIRAEARTVLGAVYRQQGDFEQGLEHYRQALALYRDLKDPRGIAATQRVMGEAYLHRLEGDKQANLEQAVALLHAARSYHRADDETLSAAMAESHLGEVAFEREAFETAIGHYQRALATFQSLDFPDGIGRLQLHLGLAKMKAGQLSEAVVHFEEALSVYRPLNDREWIRVALFGLGLTQERLGNEVGARARYREALAVFESIRGGVVGGERGEVLFARANRELFERLVALLVKAGKVEEALDVVERSRLEALRENLFNVRPDQPRQRNRDEPGMAALVAVERERAFLQTRRRQATDRRVQADLVETLAANEQQALKLAAQLGRRYRGIGRTLELVPNTRAFRHSPTFPADLALVSYFITDDRLYIFVVKRGREAVVKALPVDGEVLAREVAVAIRLIGREQAMPFPRQDAEAPLPAALGTLYQRLMAPIEAELADVETVAVLPVRWLNFLPFGALVSRDETGQAVFLQERKQVGYLFTHTYAESLYRLERASGFRDIASIVAFGNPDLADADLALPFAAQEVQGIRQSFPQAVVFTDAAATKTAFSRHWDRYEIVHVAAHARLERDQASLSLAPADGGRIGMDEFYDLPPAERIRLMVLSACQTAVDPELTGIVWQDRLTEGSAMAPGGPLASVAHTLLLVGVPAVAATLWTIDDQGTALLMSRFYQRLQAGEALAAALTTAQRLMAGRRDRYSQPYYWAAFVFYGAGS